MKSSLFLLAGGLLIASAYAAETASAPPNLHNLMKNIVAVQTQVIWDVGNDAQNDKGDPDPAKMKAADWAKVGAAAGKVRDAAQALAKAPHVMAAAPGEKIDGEGGTPGAFGAKEVQKAIDANPKVFQAFATQLTKSMDELVTAAKTKDAKKLFDVSGRLDQECEGCHTQFWYPNEKR
ncbi:MAG: cytochrome c [Gammaproteobacteria bacterium]